MQLSISDDDLCSSCRNCWYDPGRESRCSEQTNEKWPAQFDQDGYAIKCKCYEKQLNDDWNWITNRMKRGES